MKNLNVNNQNGRSMIEMLGVLAIIGVLSVGGIAGYSKAMMKYRINKTIEQITLIAGNVRTFFAPQRSFYDIRTAAVRLNIIKKAKLIPDEMWNEDKTSMVNVWGYTFDLAGYKDDVSNEYTVFSTMFYGVPVEACIELSTQDWTSLNLKSINIVAEGRDEDYRLTPPIDIAIAAEKCSTLGSPSGSVFMNFLFKGF